MHANIIRRCRTPSAPGLMALTSLSIGSARFRVGACQDAAEVAYLAPLTAATTLMPAVLAALRQRLCDLGYRAVITAAVAERERDLLIDDGFDVRSELAVLSRELDGSAATLTGAGGRVRRARRRDLDAVLGVDSAAFAPFWRLGTQGLREALTAAPHNRWRVNHGPVVAAYSIAGRAGCRGYLQRLAVAPHCQGQGLGTLLVSDALAWLQRGGARTALVNTQPDNAKAFALYERGGFNIEPERLAVLRRDLP